MELQEVLRLHKMWISSECGGVRANLTEANLRGANLDYSCLPLWCGSLKANFDDKVTTQILYHLLSIATHSNNVSQELKDILLTDSLIEQANKFHRVNECGKIER